MRSLVRLSTGLLLAIIPACALAYSLPTPAIITTCTVPGLSCIGGDMTAYINGTVMVVIRVAYGGVLLGAMIYYALKLLFTADSDNAFTETRQSYEYAILGTIFFLGAELIASSFTTKGLVKSEGIVSVFTSIYVMFKAFIATMLVINIAVQGFRMIVAEEDQEMSGARKRFIQGIVGAAIVLLASPLVHAVFGKDAPAGFIEIVGIANFLITIFGFLAVIAIIVSGLMLILSVDDGLKDRAKKILTSSIIALLIVVSAAAFVNIFILPS